MTLGGEELPPYKPDPGLTDALTGGAFGMAGAGMPAGAYGLSPQTQNKLSAYDKRQQDQQWQARIYGQYP
jgi:hypothetical protein